MRAIIIALYPYQATGQNAWLDHGAGMTYTTAREADYNRYPFGKKLKTLIIIMFRLFWEDIENKIDYFEQLKKRGDNRID